MELTIETKKIIGYGVVGLLLVSLVVYMGINVVPRVLVTLTKAAPSTVVSIKDSYILGKKMKALADGVDACTINLFVLDSDGKPVANKTGKLTGAVNAKPETGTSNSEGLIEFQVQSTVEGQQVVSATIEEVPIGRELVLTFRN